MQQQFVPWLYTTAAGIRQVSLRDMAFDAAVMAAGVIDAARLFQSPVLCLNFDLTLWAEAAGCTTNWGQVPPRVETGGSADPNPDTVRDSARITAVVDAAKRIKGAMPQHPLVCAIAGPATMASYLELDSAPSAMDQYVVAELITEYVNLLCENQIDNIVIVEDANIDDSALATWVIGKQYSRIAKLADHYAVATTLLCAQASLNNAQVTEFDSLTYVIAQTDKTVEASFVHAVKGLAVDNFGTGSVSLPAGLDALEPGSYFLTTAQDLEPNKEFSNIQKDISTINSFLTGS